MDGGSIAIFSLLAVNVGAVAFSYGKLSQKVADLCRRIEKLEKILNGKGG